VKGHDGCSMCVIEPRGWSWTYPHDGERVYTNSRLSPIFSRLDSPLSPIYSSFTFPLFPRSIPLEFLPASRGRLPRRFAPEIRLRFGTTVQFEGDDDGRTGGGSRSDNYLVKVN
jgi:hypothetical protein